MKLTILIVITLSLVLYSNQKIGKLDKIRGVNLGGWLVLEPWIRPSIFDQFYHQPREKTAIDELTFNTKLGVQEAKRQLEHHWDTWITEYDFYLLSKWGINLLRIPIGWWILGEDPRYNSAIQVLDRGIKLAEKYNLTVLIDLHGAPGSQNGYDNSGTACSNIQFGKMCATDCPADFSWHKDASNIEYTQHVLLTIAKRYKNSPNVFGIELLNEPNHIDINFMKGFYNDTYFKLREIIPEEWVIVMHDDYFNADQWKGFMQDKNVYKNVLIDTHVYFSFTTEWMGLSPEEVLLLPCQEKSHINSMSNLLPLVVGEFSLAKDDCALYLNGFKQPTRKEFRGEKCEDNNNKEFLTEFMRNQLWVYEQAEGWIFWNFWTELHQDDWNFIMLIINGILPKSANDIPEFIAQSKCNKLNQLNK